MLCVCAGARHAAGHRHAGHGVPHGHQPPVHAALAQPRAAPRGADPGGPHPRDTEGEGHPHLQPAHAYQVTITSY